MDGKIKIIYFENEQNKKYNITHQMDDKICSDEILTQMCERCGMCVSLILKMVQCMINTEWICDCLRWILMRTDPLDFVY